LTFIPHKRIKLIQQENNRWEKCEMNEWTWTIFTCCYFFLSFPPLFNRLQPQCTLIPLLLLLPGDYFHILRRVEVSYFYDVGECEQKASLLMMNNLKELKWKSQNPLEQLSSERERERTNTFIAVYSRFMGQINDKILLLYVTCCSKR
jgi:hypothetical protein